MARIVPPTPRHDKAPGASKRSTLPGDRVIAANIRALRLRRGLSQGAVAERLGVSFQQLQKYENGTNRIGAGRLAQIAAALGTPVITLYVGVEGAWSGNKAPPPITDAHALRAAEALAAIADPGVRRALLTLIEHAATLARHPAGQRW